MIWCFVDFVVKNFGMVDVSDDSKLSVSGASGWGKKNELLWYRVGDTFNIKRWPTYFLQGGLLQVGSSKTPFKGVKSAQANPCIYEAIYRCYGAPTCNW